MTPEREEENEKARKEYEKLITNMTTLSVSTFKREREGRVRDVTRHDILVYFGGTMNFAGHKQTLNYYKLISFMKIDISTMLNQAQVQ